MSGTCGPRGDSLRGGRPLRGECAALVVLIHKECLLTVRVLLLLLVFLSFASLLFFLVAELHHGTQTARLHDLVLALLLLILRVLLGVVALQ
jgi:hypothetical protein